MRGVSAYLDSKLGIPALRDRPFRFIVTDFRAYSESSVTMPESCFKLRDVLRMFHSGDVSTWLSHFDEARNIALALGA